MNDAIKRPRSEPLPIETPLRQLMDRLGVVDASLWTRLQDEWETLSGNPWAAQTRPLAMQGKTLVIEAASPQAVAMLRYGTSGLAHRLNAQLGDNTISSVIVKPPSRA